MSAISGCLTYQKAIADLSHSAADNPSVLISGVLNILFNSGMICFFRFLAKEVSALLSSGFWGIIPNSLSFRAGTFILLISNEEASEGKLAAGVEVFCWGLLFPFFAKSFPCLALFKESNCCFARCIRACISSAVGGFFCAKVREKLNKKTFNRMRVFIAYHFPKII